MMSRLPKAHDVSVQYWKDPSFLEWLKSFGVEQPTEIPSYKDGGNGRAYFLDNLVVKFSSNPVEAHVAEMVAGRSDLPTPIIAVKPLSQGLFAILEHRVQMGDEIDKRIREAADWLTLVVDKNPNMNGFPKDEKEQEDLVIRSTKGHTRPLQIMPYIKMVIEALSQLYHATGFKHDDAGPTNVGLHQGRVVFPDLGPNQPGNFSVDKSMQKIFQNRQSLGLNPS